MQFSDLIYLLTPNFILNYVESYAIKLKNFMKFCFYYVS